MRWARGIPGRPDPGSRHQRHIIIVVHNFDKVRYTTFLIREMSVAAGNMASGNHPRAKRCPQARQSGTKTSTGKAGKGNPYLNGILGEIAAWAGPALRVVNDRDFDAPVAVHRPAGQPAAEEGEVGDFLDDGLGDASPRVAQDGGVAELESEGDRGIDPVVEAGDDDHLRGGQGEWHGGEGAGELLVAPEQRGHPAGHGGSVPLWPSFVDSDH